MPFEDLIDKMAEEMDVMITREQKGSVDTDPESVDKLASVMEHVATAILGVDKNEDVLDESLQNIIIDKKMDGRRLRQEQFIKERLGTQGLIQQ
jgi:hypothetical protein